MNDIFYYFGFIFIAHSIHSLIVLFKPNKDSILMKDMMDSGFNDIKDKVFRVEEHANKAIKQDGLAPSGIISIFFFIWLVTGYITDTPEKYLFLLYILISAIYTLSLIYTIVSGTNGIGTGKLSLDLGDSINKFTIWVRIKLFICLVIISYILIHHFFLS